MKESLFKKIEDSDFEIVDGDRGSNYPNQAELKETGYCLFLSADNVTKEGFEFSKCNYITLEKDNKLRKGKLKYEDIVITTRGTIGNTVYYHKEIPLENIRINSGMIILRKKNHDVCSRFFYYVLKSKFAREQFDLFASGTAQPQLPIKDFKKIKIPYPGLEVQKQIASILSVYDDLIDVNTQRIKLLEETARELYKEWFVRMRFPGYQSTRFEKGVPYGWNLKPLNTVADIMFGYPFQSDLFNDKQNGLPIVRIRDLIAGETNTYTTEIVHEKYLALHGDIVVGMDGDFHMCKWASNKAWINQRNVRFRPIEKDIVSRYFLYHALRPQIEFLNEIIVGTTVAHLSAWDLKKMKLLIPTDELLLKFKKIADPIYDQEIILKRENAQLRLIRDRLLPRLISGKLKVKVAEETPCL